MLAAAVASLEPVSFEEVGSDTLLDRVDTKYVMPLGLVGEVLAQIEPDYRVILYAGKPSSRYRTEYYDTVDYDAYRDHQIGRIPRAKVRVRSYVDSDLSFLEIKWKTARGRTIKVRERYHGDWAAAVEAIRRGPDAEYTRGIPWEYLRPSLRIDYDRITLMARNRTERVTLDLRLAYRDGSAAAVYPGVAIIEVKQSRATRVGITAALRERGIREVSLSKYRLGLVRLHPDRVKSNGYRRLLERLNWMNQSNAAAVTAA